MTNNQSMLLLKLIEARQPIYDDIKALCLKLNKPEVAKEQYEWLDRLNATITKARFDVEMAAVEAFVANPDIDIVQWARDEYKKIYG